MRNQTTDKNLKVKYFLLVSIILTGCLTSYKIPSKKYGDKLISTIQSGDGTTTYQFSRHDLEYVDIARGHKLLERKVYDRKQIIYRYPIFSRLTENSYLIKPAANNIGYARLYISVSDNYEEVKNRNGFISDSLVLPIR